MNFLGKIMKTFNKILILSFILLILSISSANAMELDEDMPVIEENALSEISIDDVSVSEMEESQATVLESNQDTDVSLNENFIDEANEINPQNNVLTASNGNAHKVSPSNYTKYFNNKGYVKTDVVKSGDTIDLSGNFNKVNFTFTIPCSITSSKRDAYLTNCVVEYLDVNSSVYSDVSNLRFTVDIEKHPSVYVVRSSHINIFNCNAYSTGANSNPTLLVGSTYCNIHHNVFETTFTGYMNMSWKRAGILLGESHYNNIYSNDVTIKDSNGIYLTTYGFDKSNYNNIYNNTIRSSAISEETGLPNPSAWAYGVHIMGDYNKAINNTIYLMYRGVDSEGSFNEIIGNDIYNLAGSYYEGNDGTDGGEYGIHASYDNTIINNTIHDSKITGSAIYMADNCSAYGNLIQNITGEHGFEFSTSASNTVVENNFINMASGNGMYVRGNMTNVTLTNNIIDSKNGTAILIKMLSKSKYPNFIDIKGNKILDFSVNAIDFSEIESKANVNSIDNYAYLSNSSFFKFFDLDGALKDIKYIDNLVFKGMFSNLGIDSIVINQNISILGEDCQIMDIPFIISSSNLKIENISLNIAKNANAFSLNNVDNIIFINNSILVDSKNYAIALNHSMIRMIDNEITINEYNPAVLNDNGSYIFYGENIIKTLADEDILSLNGSILKIIVFIVSDENYDLLFDSNGVFRDDFDIAIGDTLKIANLTNKVIRIDIPLLISSYKDSVISNSKIILEDMASYTNITNLRFKIDDESIRDFSFITIKDGVSNLIIENNQFNTSNLIGEKFSAIKIIGSDESAKDISILNNCFNLNLSINSAFAISSLNEGLNIYDDIADSLLIKNNNISIYNSLMDGLSYGIYMTRSNNLEISYNTILSNGSTAFGIYLDKVSKYDIKENLIRVRGFNYQAFMNYINSISGDFNIAEYISENLTNRDAAIYAKNSQNPLIMNNRLYENNELVSIVHSNDASYDIQSIIDSSIDGSTIYLGANLYSIGDSIIINKSISLFGGILLDNIDSSSNPMVSNHDPLFVVLPNGTVDFFNMNILLDNDDLFVLSVLKSTANPIGVDYSTVNIKYNKFLKVNSDLIGESISLAKSISENVLFEPVENIYLKDNKLIENMGLIGYYVFNDSSSNEINFNDGLKTMISSDNLIFTALDNAIYGNSIKYVPVRLFAEDKKPLANKKIYVSYNNAIYAISTDANGIAKLSVSINAYGIYDMLISFLGDNVYSASFSSSKLTVNKQKAILIAPNQSYYVNAKKYLTAAFKDINGNPIKSKKISFILNGKTYNAYTNSKGVASIKVKISTAKTYIVTVKYAGDNVYAPISKSFKVYVKKIKTKLVVKNKSYKKSKKVKKLTATLKSGKKVIKGKKLIFTINKKKYRAKTNKRGMASVKVRVSKRKSYKFTVKFAGDDTYLKSSKKAKLRIR